MKDNNLKVKSTHRVVMTCGKMKVMEINQPIIQPGYKISVMKLVKQFTYPIHKQI
jgi:hypothetical protein